MQCNDPSRRRGLFLLTAFTVNIFNFAHKLGLLCFFNLANPGLTSSNSEIYYYFNKLPIQKFSIQYIVQNKAVYLLKLVI